MQLRMVEGVHPGMSRHCGVVYMSNKKALMSKMVSFEEEEDVGV
jgi:hypothetical protein